MVIVQMLGSSVLIPLTFVATFHYGCLPWVNWKNVHYEFSRIGIIHLLELDPLIRRWALALRWIAPMSAFVFFAFFSFTTGMMNDYRAISKPLRRVIVRSNGKLKFQCDHWTSQRM
jgi:pheromone a factor receptor